MNIVNTTFKNIKNHEIILGIILILYIFGEYKTPTEISPYITNFISYVVMLVLVAITFIHTNLVLALLLGISFMILVQRSNTSHPLSVMPSQSYKESVMQNLNADNTFNSDQSSSNKQELEEVMVSNIATINYRAEEIQDITFKPTLSTKNNVFELQNLD